LSERRGKAEGRVGGQVGLGSIVGFRRGAMLCQVCSFVTALSCTRTVCVSSIPVTYQEKGIDERTRGLLFSGSYYSYLKVSYLSLR
jgi:hypothetical protein